MYSLSGIDTARSLRDSDSRTLLVFTTSSDGYALDAFSLHPFDYVMKPCTPGKLGCALTDEGQAVGYAVLIPCRHGRDGSCRGVFRRIRVRTAAILIAITVFMLYMIIVDAETGKKIFCFANSLMLCVICPMYTMFINAQQGLRARAYHVGFSFPMSCL